MVLVIDTSGARSALALLRPGAEGNAAAVVAEDVVDARRDDDLAGRAAALTAPERLSVVLVTLGPGSFTGLRGGVSFGLGLALGLGLPLLGLGSLELQAARAGEPATALVEAGRGRLYWLAPGAAEGPRLGPPSELPRALPAVGWLRPATAETVRATGLRLLEEGELEGAGAAAARLLGGARALGYDTVRLTYMQSFGRLR